MKKVSVIIPCYNNAAFVGKAVDSLLSQTFPDFEAIIIDDGSTDNTLIAAKDAALGDPRFYFASADHGGVSAARNLGIGIAKGEYIMFLDSDDALSADAIEKLVEAADGSGADIVSGGFVKKCGEKIISVASPSVSGAFSGADKEKILQMACVGSDAALVSFIDKLYKSSLIKENGIHFPGIISGEDSVFALDAMMTASLVYFLPEHNYYYYEQNPESFTKKKISVVERMSLSDIFFKGMEETIKKHGREDLLKYLCARKTLAIYDFVMNTVSRDDLSKKDKKEAVRAVSEHSFYREGLDKEAMSFHSARVRLLVSLVLKKKICLSYFTAYWITAAKRILGKQ